MPSPELLLEATLNPYGFSTPNAVLIGAGVGTADGLITGIAISTALHDRIHGGIRYSERLRKGLDVVNYLYTGMAPADWIDHLAHHAYGDKIDVVAQTK